MTITSQTDIDFFNKAKTNTPSVCVILLNWNGLADTSECLRSLREQDYPSLKRIVVDNGSVEDEARAIERDFPEATVLRQETNLGFCGGNNAGMRHALAEGADYVLILNNDTIAPPNLISELVASSERLGRVGAVSPAIFCYPKTDLIWYAGSEWEAATAGFRHPLIYQSRKELNVTEPFQTAYACGCCLLVSAATLSRVGLMDERYFIYYDEADWCSRMQKAGLKCYVIPKAVLYHKVSQATPGLITTYFMARNRLLWMKDHLRWQERVRSYPYLLKEIVWNLCNLAGLRPAKHKLSITESKAMLLAIRDFIRGRFGASPAKIIRLSRLVNSAKPVTVAGDETKL